MKAIGKYILVKQIKEEVKSGGVILSGEEADELRYKKGTVIEPGTDVTVIKKGDTIHYDLRAGHTMLINDESVTVISERDVVIVL